MRQPPSKGLLRAQIKPRWLYPQSQNKALKAQLFGVASHSLSITFILPKKKTKAYRRNYLKNVFRVFSVLQIFGKIYSVEMFEKS
ncbi:hypothetical protein STRDD11_00892 [Streptococcus sp. DD11]|nr:hypothetical protein STRDD11_00892 [Streptococcus sp. DD11]